MAMLTTRLIGLGSVTSRNASYFEQDIANAAAYGYGVTAVVGFADASTGATSRTTTISYTFLDQFLDLLTEYGVACQWNMGEGPPTHSSWKALNGGNAWPSTNRPPSGLHATLKTHWEAILARVMLKRSAANQDSTEYDCFRIWGEGGKGGVLDGRDAGVSPATYSSPWSGYSSGTWDDELHTLLVTLSSIDWQGHIVVGPALECEDATSSTLGPTVTQEIATYGASAGDDWRQVCADSNGGVPIFSIDIYPTASTSTLAAAVAEFEGKLDRVINSMKSQNWCPSDALFNVGEHGWQVLTSGGTSNKGEMAKWRIECETIAMADPRVWGFSHYTMRDDTWGLFMADGSATPAKFFFDPTTAQSAYLRYGINRSVPVRRRFAAR